RSRHTRFSRDWSSDVCSSDLRKSIENLYADSTLSDTDGVLIVEVKKDKNAYYFDGVYGGITYEDKKRTSYIGIGEYSKIDDSSRSEERRVGKECRSRWST